MSLWDAGFETAPTYLPKFLSASVYLCISQVTLDTVSTWKDFLFPDNFLVMYILEKVLLHTV